MKQAERDPLWCPPSAMEVCTPPSLSKNVKMYAKGLTIDYLVCQYKQRVLAECISKYENQNKEKGTP